MSQPSFQDWLNRKPAGPKPKKRLKRTPLKRPTKPIRRASPRHTKALKQYFRVRAQYLGENPACEAGPVILAAKLPDAYQVPRCGVWSKEVHHLAGRGPNLCNTATFCAICPACHAWVHSHAQKSRELGLLA